MAKEQKARSFRRLKATFSGAALAALALHPQPAMQAARDACQLWATGVLPSLFPFMVLSRMLAGALGGGMLAVPVSMLAGSPAGAKLLAISGGGQQAQQKAALCATASPLFLLGTLGGDFRMVTAHWLGAAAAGAFTRLFPSPATPAHASVPPSRASLPGIIADSALAMLSVCGCMAFFSVLTALAESLLPLPAGAQAALSAFLEMAGGCARIMKLPVSDAQRTALLCGAASFGGLSVFLQNMPYLREAGVNLRIQFAAKIVHALTAYFFCLLLHRF